jgi:hypothetical protein
MPEYAETAAEKALRAKALADTTTMYPGTFVALGYKPGNPKSRL